MKKLQAWYFLLGVILIYIILFFVFPTTFWTSFHFFQKILLKILPIFILIFVLMVIVNRYMSNAFIIKHVRGNKIKAWFYIIIGGILSTGPMYMWYPLLKDLREKGMNNGEVACFLYNRSIKPAYLPLIVIYFGLKYTIILTLLIITFSLLQAFIIEKIVPLYER